MSTPNNSSRMTLPPNLKDRDRTLKDPKVLAFIEGEQTTPATSSSTAPIEPIPVHTPPPPVSIPPVAPPSKLPWDGMSDSYLKQKPFRMYENEAEMLNYLGETTYGETSQSIFLTAIRAEIAKRFEERGFVVTADPKTGKLSISTVPVTGGK